MNDSKKLKVLIFLSLFLFVYSNNTLCQIEEVRTGKSLVADSVDLSDKGIKKAVEVWQKYIQCLREGDEKKARECWNKEELKKLFKKIKRKNYLFAWEPRGDWKEKEIEKLCKDLDLIHCVDPFKNKTTTKKLAYFRLHGKKRYRYNYTDYDLMLIQQNKPIYVGETLACPARVVSRWSWEGIPINRDFARLNKPLPYRKILLI